MPTGPELQSAPFTSSIRIKKQLPDALCDECGRKAIDLWTCLETRAGSLSLKELVKQYIDQMVGFVDGNPAFLSLTDLPSSAFNPGMRERLRERLASVLQRHAPHVRPASALRLADIMLQINKGLMSRYALAKPEDREWVVDEFHAVLTAYLKSRLHEPRTS